MINREKARRKLPPTPARTDAVARDELLMRDDVLLPRRAVVNTLCAVSPASSKKAREG